jgi:uncharacterized protein
MTGEAFQQEAVVDAPLIPFDEIVVKTNTLCDKMPRYDRDGVFVGGCDYVPVAEAEITNKHGCYEYENNMWRSQPPRMSDEVVLKGAQRLGEHAGAHSLQDMRVIRHGGEPLLDSAEQVDWFSTTVRTGITTQSPDTNVHMGIQTNGLALAKEGKDGDKLAVLKQHNYQVGLSLDGDREAQDRHRTGPRGESDYDKVVYAAKLLRDSGVTWGILCVIDTDNDPVATVKSLASHEPGSISLLLPHANHSVLPQPGAMSYGDWQIAAFDWYYDQPAESRIAMPIFDSYMDVLLGGLSKHEGVANRKTQELFMLANGYYQRVDTIKSTEPGAVATGMSIFEHSMDDVARSDPGIIARRLGNAGLAKECLECPLLKPCSGGYYPHRFKSGKHRIKITDPVEVFADAFRHPTIYCDDQLKLIPHMASRMEDDLGIHRGTLVEALAGV